MPSLFRFLTVLILLGGIVGGGLYVLSEHFAPEARETKATVSGVKIRR